MTHRFMFKTDAGEMVSFTVEPEYVSSMPAMSRSAWLWHLDRSMNENVPVLKPEQLPRYHAWTTEVLACAVSKVKRRLYKKVKG